MAVDLSTYKDLFGFRNKAYRFLWSVTSFFLFKPFFLNFGPIRKWRVLVLRMFGAKVSFSANIYSNALIWSPRNLIVGDYSTIGPKVNCYNQDKVILGSNVVISQYSYLCAGSHDASRPDLPHITAPIKIEDQAWITADVFISMGVTIGEGAVVGARAAVFKDVEPWTIVGGNPAKFIKKRELKDE